MAITSYSAKFDIGEQVVMDTEKSIIATITGIAFYDGRTQYECCWFANGVPLSSWLDGWRLREWKP